MAIVPLIGSPNTTRATDRSRPGFEMTALGRALSGPSPDDAVHRLPIHPVAFAAVYVLSVFVEVQISPHAMVRSLIVATGVAALLTALIWLVVRDSRKAAAVASLTLLAFIGWHAPLLVLVGLALTVLIALLVRRVTGTGVPWPKVTFALNVVAAVLLVAVGIKAVTAGSVSEVFADLRQGGSLPPAAAQPRAAGPPDFYFVLLDAYPRGDTLRRLFDYDNEPFLGALEARGFDVARSSRANYAATKLTLASMLNMRLLHDIEELAPIIAGDRPELSTLRRITNEATGVRLAREHGYQLIATAGGYEETSMRSFDVFLDGGQINEFEMILLRPTAATELLRVAAPDFLGDEQRARIEFGLDALRRLAATPSTQPRFALVHIPSPHAPIVYGADGARPRVDLARPHDYDSDGQTPAEQVAQYREQLDYLNQQILASLDAVLAQPGVAPVVVVWSDHGSLIDLDTDPRLRVTERISNLFAARTPERGGLFADDATLVNVLPTLFNAYLGTQLATAPERVFVSQQPTLYDWVELEPGAAASPMGAP